MLEVALSTPANSAVAFGYTLGVDDDPESDDADASDHSHGGGGTIEITTGASSASIEIAITDDDDIEPAREVVAVTLDLPGEETGYVRGYPHAAQVTIEEGVCDRTPRIRDEIVEQAGAVGCIEIDGPVLARIRTLNLSGGQWTSDGGGRTSGHITVVRQGTEAFLKPCDPITTPGPDGAWQERGARRQFPSSSPIWPTPTRSMRARVSDAKDTKTVPAGARPADS